MAKIFLAAAIGFIVGWILRSIKYTGRLDIFVGDVKDTYRFVFYKPADSLKNVHSITFKVNQIHGTQEKQGSK